MNADENKMLIGVHRRPINDFFTAFHYKMLIGVHRRPINDFFTAFHGRGSELEYSLHRDRVGRRAVLLASGGGADRSEEHTSELQSRQYLVCRLLLEKTKNHTALRHESQSTLIILPHGREDHRC